MESPAQSPCSVADLRRLLPLLASSCDKAVPVASPPAAQPFTEGAPSECRPSPSCCHLLFLLSGVPLSSSPSAHTISSSPLHRYCGWSSRWQSDGSNGTCTRSPRTPSFPSSGIWYVASLGPGSSSVAAPTCPLRVPWVREADFEASSHSSFCLLSSLSLALPLSLGVPSQSSLHFRQAQTTVVAC